MAQNPKRHRGVRVRQIAFLGLSLLVLGAVVAVILMTEDTVDVTQSDAKPAPPSVSVLVVEAAAQRAEVSSYAELRPQWSAQISAAVSGKILKVHDSALAGTRVAVGEPLITIDSSQYETAVAAAELALEEAKLARLRAENRVVIARKQFQREGADAPNELALHLPELRIANRSVVSAQAQLAAARQGLANTVVKAPFSGFVVARSASLGQTVSQGDALLRLADDTRYELELKLSQDDWALLQQPVAGQIARLVDRTGAQVGEARIRNGGGFLDQDTRQIRVFLEVSAPSDSLLAGAYLRVIIDGQVFEDAVTLPATALTRAGHLWRVDAQNKLVRFAPEILFRTEQTITFAPPDGPGPWRFARVPLAAFLPGQDVTPILGADQ